MISPISVSSALPPLERLSVRGIEPARTDSAGVNTTGNVSFQDVLLKSLEQVNELDRQSQSMIAGALTGDDYTQAEVFTAVKKADLAFRTMLQIRNKILEAYNELKDLRM
jgi:flagellar hook-basal body complex protein FliE